MRLRNIAGAEEKLLQYDHFIATPNIHKGGWHKYFGNNHPIHLEIGCGKGQFITTLATKEPYINFIALEKYASIMLKAVNKIPPQGLDNIAFITTDAQYLDETFAANEIDKIYLTFSDPWPKDRHAKRRLTHHNFLNLYKKFLSPEGILQFKTDNTQLFDFSLQQLEDSGWNIQYKTYDLHNSEYAADNIMTEYEQRFSSMGMPICMVNAKVSS